MLEARQMSADAYADEDLYLSSPRLKALSGDFSVLAADCTGSVSLSTWGEK